MKRWKLIAAIAALVLVSLLAATKLILPHIYSEDATTSWTYHSSKYDFSMTLPSSDWQEIQRQDAAAAFHNRKRAVLASANVSRGDQEAFEKAVQRMKDYMRKNKDQMLSEPQFTEGTTEDGDPFSYWTVQAKADRGEATFVANSLVWCKNKGLIVGVMMEGLLDMRSKTGESAELDFYEKSARTICLSVR